MTKESAANDGPVEGGKVVEDGSADVDAEALPDGQDCVPATYQCLDAVLQVCGPDGFWMTSATCASADLCDPSAGECTPPTCQPGDHHCNGADLQQCNSSLNGWTYAETCPNAAFCDAVGGKCMSAPCAAGDYQCSGADLQICDPQQL